MLIHLSRNGEAHGPYTAEQFEEMLSTGQVQHTDEMWVQSDGWEPLSHFERCFGHHDDCPPPQQHRFGTPAAAVPLPPASSMRLVTQRPLRSAAMHDDEEGNVNLLRTMMGV